MCLNTHSADTKAVGGTGSLKGKTPKYISFWGKISSESRIFPQVLCFPLPPWLRSEPEWPLINNDQLSPERSSGDRTREQDARWGRQKMQMHQWPRALLVRGRPKQQVLFLLFPHSSLQSSLFLSFHPIYSTHPVLFPFRRFTRWRMTAH